MRLPARFFIDVQSAPGQVLSMHDEPLQFKVDELSDRRVISLSGKLILYNIEELRQELFRLAEVDQKDVVIDLEKLDYLDSSGIGLLVQVHRKVTAGGRKIQLQETGESLLRVLKAAGLDRIFEFI